MELNNFKPFFHESWLNELSEFLTSEKMVKVISKVKERKNKNAKIYPSEDKFFRIYKELPFDEIKVVILGEEPSYVPGEADGLAYSCNIENYIPTALENIYREIDSDIYNNKFNVHREPSLYWLQEQGVLLMNMTLSVESAMPEIHKNVWKEFSEFVLKKLDNSDPKVFMVWGNDLSKYADKLDSKHLILKAGSPIAHKKEQFAGNKHFSVANEFLKGIYGEGSEIEWRSPPF